MQSLKVLSGQNPREIAVEVLGRRSTTEYVEVILEQTLAGKHLPMNDRGLCQELVYGVVRNSAALDFLVAAKTQGRTQKPALLNILRLGLYQIFWLDRIPNHAAVNETVELAKRRGFGPQSGFVNALLRGYLRDLEGTRARLEELKVKEPWTGYSHPEWLVKRWLARFGPEKTTQLLTRNNAPAETYARINALKIDGEKLLPIWRDENVDYDFIHKDWIGDNVVFRLKSHPPLHKIPSFQQGFFYVQDPSTLLAAAELGAQPGESVLDVCAAPGGKLGYIAAAMRNEGRLVAQDLTEERLKLVRENCKRLGITCAHACLPRQWPPNVPAIFDRILIDAPCSNTGVMRRRVELRWRIKPEEVDRLRVQQRTLLNDFAPHLKKGGTLVYSTCSIEPEENQNVVREFLEQSPGWKLMKERELLPFDTDTDGAYVATLQKM